MPTKRPLLATASDQNRYVDEGARRDARDAALRNRNVLISGAPGVGKTSLLMRIAFLGKESDIPSIIVQARLAEDASAIVELLIAEAEDAEWIEEDDPGRVPRDPLAAAREIRRLQNAPPGGIVLLDDPTSGQARTLFGQLRDELWQLPVSFVVAASPRVAEGLQRPPADAFFDRAIGLAPFTSDEAAVALSRLKAAGENLAVDVAPTHPINPRDLVALAAGETVEERVDPAVQFEIMERAEGLTGRIGGMLVAEIWNEGAVSASDEALQRSLGISRNRLTELLRTLADARVLAAHTDDGGGRAGRPRTLYAIRFQP